MSSKVPVPTSTVVLLRRSAFGCFSQLITLPTTIPCRLPLILSNDSIPSTSRPVSVRYSAIFLGFKSVLMYSCSQLFEIFILIILIAYRVPAPPVNRKNQHPKFYFIQRTNIVKFRQRRNNHTQK